MKTKKERQIKKEKNTPETPLGNWKVYFPNKKEPILIYELFKFTSFYVCYIDSFPFSETSDYSCSFCYQISEIKEFYGYGNLALKLYEKAKI